MKLLICGSRNFNNYELLKKTIKKPEKITAIISGCAAGADTLGIRYALEHNIPIEKFPAQWDKFGRSAGILRDTKMVNNADAVLAFWDGTSKGTEYTINYTRRCNKYLKVIYYKEVK